MAYGHIVLGAQLSFDSTNHCILHDLTAVTGQRTIFSSCLQTVNLPLRKRTIFCSVTPRLKCGNWRGKGARSFDNSRGRSLPGMLELSVRERGKPRSKAFCHNLCTIQFGKKKINNTSGFVGVHKHRDKWQAKFTLQRKRRCVGSFLKKEDAAFARALAIAIL